MPSSVDDKAAPPTPEPAPAPAVSEVDPADFHVTVEEFCTRKSKTDRRVELLGGFHFDEVRSGHLKDSEDAFEARFVAFENRPA